MADESLGHIDIRFPTAGGGGGGTGGGGGGTAATGNAFGTALTNILKNAGSFKNVISTGVGGGSVGEIVGGAAGAARSAGGGMGAVGLGAAVGGIAIIAAGMVAVRMAVSSILTRVSELARVNPAMAMQAALSNIAEMKRDMAEAKVLGPLYTMVSELARTIQDMLAPIFNAIKAILTGVIVILLQVFKSLLERMMPIIASIAQGIGNLILQAVENKTALQLLSVGLSQSFNPILSGIGYIMQSFTMSNPKFWATMTVIGNTLVQISGQITAATSTTAGSNAYFTDMLKALSAPSATGIPAGLPRPRFTSP